MRRPDRFLAGLTAEQFLADYWQQRPLLCRGALPDYEPPVTADELAGLSLESEVESRLISADDWTLRQGPFTEETFAELPEKDWTLLIQDLDQHLPEIAPLLTLLDFLPAWRLDDVMASVAPPGGSVGPHFDQYDVFLLQVSGRRSWQVSERFDPTLRPDTDLSILEHFQPEQQWELEPGDMLYVPPQVAHYGVATTDCVTYSLGCRAPSVAEVITHFASERITTLDQRLPESDRYRDPAGAIRRKDERGGIRQNELAEVHSLLDVHLSWTADDIAKGFTQLMSQPKALFAQPPEELTDAEADELRSEARSFRRRKGSRWIHAPLTTGHCLAVNGQHWTTDEGSLSALEQLCTAPSLHQSELAAIERAVGRNLVGDLLRLGWLEAQQ